jgi:hypothetical protein
MHFDGVGWAAQTSGTTADLKGVWGSSTTDVFAVGGSGTILHYDGSVWTPHSSGFDNWLFGVGGRSADDVFAVGAGGTIFHYIYGG